MKPVKAVLFDCDGTLVDSLGMAMHSFNFALDQIGLPPRSPEAIKKYFGSSADKILIQVLNDYKLAGAEEAFKIYLQHQKEMAIQTKLFPGVLSVLQAVQKKKLPMGVVTGRHQLDLEIVIDPHDIKNYFTTIITDDMLSAPKPDPQGIVKAAQNLGVAAEEVIYIGDSVVDMQAAKSAGAFAVAALWDGLANREEMLFHGADIACESPAKFLEYIQSKLNVSI